MLIWHASGAHPLIVLSNCLLLLEEIFMKPALSKYQQNVSENATGVQMSHTLTKNPSRGILTS